MRNNSKLEINVFKKKTKNVSIEKIIRMSPKLRSGQSHKAQSFIRKKTQAAKEEATEFKIRVMCDAKCFRFYYHCFVFCNYFCNQLW